jgi:hypothetical protein
VAPIIMNKTSFTWFLSFPAIFVLPLQA